MSNIDPTITNAEVIPHIVTEVFKDNPTARFATGLIAYGEAPREGMDEIVGGYLKLREKVYIDQTRMLTEEARLATGGEIDEDDGRSVHFCVLENLGDTQRVVASMRVIHGGDHGRLPIEEFFPQIAQSTNGTSKSIEISRYICRHEDEKVQNKLKWLLYPAVLAYIMKNKLGPTYAVVEEPLEAALLGANVPIKRIADPVWVEEYKDFNLGIVIDTHQLAANIEAQAPGSVNGIDLNSFVFSGTRPELVVTD